MGRVVEETIVNTYNARGVLDATRRFTFAYDAHGNQNGVFQFIFRNYSMNNSAPQARYNSLGLPLSMNPANDAFFNTLTDQVVYDCQ